MRIWKLNLKSTFFSLLGHVSALPDAPQALRLEQLRLAMLGTLGDDGCERHARVARQLRYADDVQALWYARIELMAALASMHGETIAREQMDHLSKLFRGLLPAGMSADRAHPPG